MVHIVVVVDMCVFCCVVIVLHTTFSLYLSSSSCSSSFRSPLFLLSSLFLLSPFSSYLPPLLSLPSLLVYARASSSNTWGWLRHCYFFSLLSFSSSLLFSSSSASGSSRRRGYTHTCIPIHTLCYTYTYPCMFFCTHRHTTHTHTHTLSLTPHFYLTFSHDSTQSCSTNSLSSLSMLWFVFNQSILSSLLSSLLSILSPCCDLCSIKVSSLLSHSHLSLPSYSFSFYR